MTEYMGSDDMLTIQTAVDAATGSTAPQAREGDEPPPRSPEHNPIDWLRENLFPNWGNTVLTIVFGGVILVTVRALMRFAFSEERVWGAVWTNVRLSMTYVYPEAQYHRVWISVGLATLLTGLTLAVWRAGDPVARRNIGRVITSFAAMAALAVVLAPFTASTKILWLVGLAILGGAGWAFRRASTHDQAVPPSYVWGAVVALIIAFLWLYPLGHYSFVDGAVQDPQPGTVAFSTKFPWTVVLLVGVAAYLIGTVIRDRLPSARLRPGLLLGWLLLVPVAFMVVLRDPSFDYGYVLGVDIPLYLAFALGGGALLWFVAAPNAGTLGRAVAAITLLVAAGSWGISLWFGVGMLQKVRISFLVLAFFAIAAPTFAGNEKGRRTYVIAWLTFLAVLHYFITVTNTPSTVQDLNTPFFTGGFAITFLVSAASLLISFPIGVMMALGRTSKMPIFRVLSTLYIEIIRGVPLITVLFAFDVLLPLFLPANMDPSRVAGIILAMTLFGAAYMAENIRGGLQSVRKGQYEAAEALGMTTAQTTTFIVLPQALRNIIPAMVGGIIATFKETSLLAIVGIFDFLLIYKSIVPNQTAFRSVRWEGLLFVAAVYWVCTYSMSRASRRLERKLGVGTH
ncbi:MAG: amino acid ABC transporter permease [Actinomycetia bacterium]|nr:amino acid ABC transporter permease [Actinomycetes bacterium]